jgi:uncharacterized protein (TIGR00251 family)
LSRPRSEPPALEGLELRADGNGVLLRVKVSAGAARTRVIGVHGGALKLSVQAPPERGKANEAVRALVAETFAVAASEVAIVKGETSPDKVLRLGLAAEAAARAISPC